MCLCLFAVNEHDEFPFILIANRDEFRKRPAAKADFWADYPNVLAGRGSATSRAAITCAASLRVAGTDVRPASATLAWLLL